MKTINNLFITLITLIICACVESCGKDYSSPLKGVSINDLSFNTSGGSETVSINNIDISGFIINTDVFWCNAIINSSTSLLITAEENKTYEDRCAIISLTDPEDGTTVSFNVKQKALGTIQISERVFKVPEEGGQISVNINSNVNYTIDIPEKYNWVKVVSTRGLIGSTAILSIDKNNSGDERKAIVTFIDQESGVSSEITINQSLSPYLSVDKDVIEVNSDGDEIEIEVNTNIKIFTDYDDYWVSSGGRIETQDMSFIQKVIVSPFNKGGGTRKTFVSFYASNSKYTNSKIVTIIQKKEGIGIEEDDFSIYEGEEYTLTLNNNTGQSVSWKSSNTSIVTVDNKGKIKGVSAGVATIKAVTSDGQYSDEISITVKRYDIESYIKAKWSVSTSSWNGYKTRSISCKLVNNSQVNIVLTKCTFYVNDQYYDSTTSSSLLGTLKPGEEKGISLNNLNDINSIYYIWEYTCSGHTYTLKTECPSALLSYY